MIYTPEELFRIYKKTPQEVCDFLGDSTFKVDVIRLEDYSFHCWKNYKEDRGSDGMGMTALEAILNAMHNLEKE